MSELSNPELRKELVRLGANPGPITDTTRNLWEKKLTKLQAEEGKGGGKTTKTATTTEAPPPPPSATRSTRKKAPPTPAANSTASEESEPLTATGRKGRPKKTQPPPVNEASDQEESEKESMTKIRGGRRSSPQKRPASPAKKSKEPVKVSTGKGIIPGLANFINKDSSPQKKRGHPTLTPVSPTIEPALSGGRGRGTKPRTSTSTTIYEDSMSRGRLSQSFGYSDSDGDVEEEVRVSGRRDIQKVDRSLNTSFKRPSLGSPIVAPASNDSGNQGTEKLLSFRRIKLEDDLDARGDFRLGSRPPLPHYGRQHEDYSFRTSNGPQPRRLSPFRNAMDWLHKFRTDTYNGLYGAWQRMSPAKQDAWRDKKTNSYKTNSEREFSPYVNETPKVLFILLVFFIVVLGLVYTGSVYRSKVTFGFKVVKSAAEDTLVFVYSNMILPLVFLAIAIGTIVSIYLYRDHKKKAAAEEKRKVFEMVNKIIEILQRNYNKFENGEKADPCVPVPHVRDLLIKPQERKEMLGVWKAAAEYVDENESRVRTETEFVKGQEISVWRWMQPSETTAAEDKIWQGHAFSEAPHQMELNAPTMGMAYSECLKLRGMFGDPDLEEEDDWAEHIQDALLEKLGSKRNRVMHMAVDRASKEGCVYMKLATRQEAGSAFAQLHGSWFNGRLISVKYLRTERYVERFPDAKRAVFPLEITKPRQSMLWK